MPKRSNKFQKLIYAIHKQLHTGAIVTESKLLTDRVTGAEREVDVVIETTTGDLEIMIGVEVIAHNRRADLPWVNTMWGKHKNLPTNKLVLVSRSGFTNTAIDEGKALGIKLMTLDEAIAADWTSIVNKLKEVFLTRCYFTPTECRAVLVEEYQPSDDPIVGPDLVLYNSQDQPQGTLREVIENVLRQPSVLQKIYDRVDRMTISSFDIRFSVTDGSYLVDAANLPREIRALRVKGNCRFLIDPVPLEHHRYGRAHVAFGEANIAEGDVLLTVVEQIGGKTTFELSLL